MSANQRRSAYESMLGGLEGSEFQDEVSTRLQGLIVDFQRIPAKPNGDGGLDGLSHDQRHAYCFYGPEHSAKKLQASGLKDDIVGKFQRDLRKLFELKAGPSGRLKHAGNDELPTILAAGVKIRSVILIVNWFESHRVIGPLNAAFTRYKARSRLRFVDPSATIVIWGPRDIVARGDVDENTLFRLESRSLFQRLRQIGEGLPLAETTGDFDAKFEDLKRRHPNRSGLVDGLAEDFRRAWAAAIALDNHLAETSVGLHEALDGARQEAAVTARLRSLGVDSPPELIEGMHRSVTERLGRHFGERLGSMTGTIAMGVVASLIGECPLDWRADADLQR